MMQSQSQLLQFHLHFHNEVLYYFLMAPKKGEKEIVHVVVAPPTEVIHTPDGSFARGEVLTSRELKPEELDKVRGLLGNFGLNIEEGSGEEPGTARPRRGRTFGISDWRGSKWVPYYDRRRAEENERNN